MTERSDATVLLAGAGNIGSHLAPLVIQAGAGLLRIVDRDRVEAKNLATQAFRPEDVGRPKAEVLAERLRRQFPGTTVEARAADLEDLPLGDFTVHLLLGALDSRRARQALVSEIAWPLGVPVVDGGVGEGLLGRVQVFVPGPDSACLECTWGESDYRQLAAEYPCVPGASAVAAPTLSPAFAGAVVAGLMTAEAACILAGNREAGGRETCFDLQHRRFLVSRLRRGGQCRFNHEIVSRIVPLGKDPAAATVADLLAVVEREFGTAPLHLECRRGLFGKDRFAMGRFLTPERLQARRCKALAALGFVPGDRIRVRSEKGSAFIVLSHEAACGIAPSEC